MAGGRRTTRSREVSNPRDWMLQRSYRSEIWQTSRQRCCRNASQISERLEKLMPESHARYYGKTSVRLVNRGHGSCGDSAKPPLKVRHWSVKYGRYYASVPNRKYIMSCHPNILIKLQNFSFTKAHLKISSAKRRTLCPGGDELSEDYLDPTLLTWTSYQIRKIAGCACAGNAGNVFAAADFNGNR